MVDVVVERHPPCHRTSPASCFNLKDVEVFADEFRTEQPRPARCPVAILVEQRDNEAAVHLLDNSRTAGVVGQFEQHFAEKTVGRRQCCAAF